VIREELDQPILKLPGVGPKTSGKLAALGYTTIRELLDLLPRGYEDRRTILPLSNALGSPPPGVRIVTVVEILDHQFFGPRGNLKIVVRDGSARATLVCFGRNFLTGTLPIGKFFLLSGLFLYRYNEIQATSFETEPLSPSVGAELETWVQSGGPAPVLPPSRQFGGILPRYSNLGGIGEAKVRFLVDHALETYARHLEDPLPHWLIDKKKLLPYTVALGQIHRPNHLSEVTQARTRLAYQELFLLQLGLAWQATQRKKLPKAKVVLEVPSLFESPSVKKILPSLGFSLTKDQVRVLEEFEKDLRGSGIMGRLLQGDVGSGKTIVGFLTAAYLADQGQQSVFMAPTELLARQHADNAHRFLSPAGLTVAFLSGGLSGANRSRLLEGLKAGRIHVLVGTHAVFTKDVEFHSLGLSIVDEQHRFGVLQRTALQKKGERVHLLLMSATPIPRTLAMTVYGDLEVSTLGEKPPGRRDIETHLARMGNEKKVYDFVRKQLEQGRQAYFVYPRIEGDSSSDDEPQPTPEIKSAEAMFEHLGKMFHNFRLGLIHGRLKEDEKTRTMAAFSQGDIDLLVSTTVVEVGVDVANATCMVIEHAERFGLAALHQLRGRVGRSELQSYCFLVYHEPLTETGKERLRIMKETNDGFLLAEKDLELRGPGDIQGIAQSGFLQFTYANLGTDMKIMNEARKDAFALLVNDPGLQRPEHSNLRKILEY